MKCIIAGSRTITDYETVKDAFDKFPFKLDVTEIVSGGARGVDTLGERVAFEYNLKVSRFPADWKLHGKGAGHIRNKQMGDYADCAVICWDGESSGTKNMIDYMMKNNKIVYVVLHEKGQNNGNN